MQCGARGHARSLGILLRYYLRHFLSAPICARGTSALTGDGQLPLLFGRRRIQLHPPNIQVEGDHITGKKVDRDMLISRAVPNGPLGDFLVSVGEMDVFGEKPGRYIIGIYNDTQLIKLWVSFNGIKQREM